MNSELMKLDTLARERIVRDVSKSFFVEAGAGSGKTTILVKRMVAMVEAGIEVNKLCAITFTKAAAGEFYDRFQQKLIERSNAPTEENFKALPGELGNPTDVTRQRCREAAQNIDLSFLGTIDSFCNMILSEHPAAAKIPSNAALLSNTELQAVYKREFSRIRRGDYGTELKNLCRLFCAYNDHPDNLFVIAMGNTVMDTRNCRYEYDSVRVSDIDEHLADEKTALQKVLRTLLDHPELEFEGEKKSQASWTALREKERLLFGEWNNEISRITSAIGQLRNLRIAVETDTDLLGVEGMKFFELHISRKKPAWYKLAEDGIPALYERLCDLKSAVTLDFLTAAAKPLAEELRRRGHLTFFDYLLYLRDLLRADAEKGGALIRHIYDRHSYFLIDEFQDTNPLQAEIFFYLAAENPVADWRACIPRGGSLFIVGDPKQSIYRFRHADVSSFLKVKELFCGEAGEVLKLTRNFRSTYKMRSWFNKTFCELLPENTPLQSKFEEIPLEEEPLSDGGFEGVFTYKSFCSADAQYSQKDPCRAATVIERLVGNPEYLIRDKKKKALREVAYRDIMLIAPRKKRLGDYMNAMSLKGIPFRVEGEVAFNECDALTVLTDLFGAVAEPYDEAKVAVALMTPVFGFTLSALRSYKKAGARLNLFAEGGDILGAEPLYDALSRLGGFVKEARSLSASALFSLLLDRLQLFRYTSTANMEYLYFALELIREGEQTGGLSTQREAAELLRGLINRETEVERAISLTPDTDKVHLANLHKVKGLEAPIVILVDPEAATVRDPNLSVVQGEDGPVCSIFGIRINQKLSISFKGNEEALEAERNRLAAERKRLLYVAATRACRALIVAECADGKESLTRQKPWDFFSSRAEKDILEDMPAGTPKKREIKEAVFAEELYAEGEREAVCLDASAAQSYEIRRPSQIKLKSKISSEDDFEDETSRHTERLHRNAAVTGTLVHRLMEALVSSKNTVSLEAAAAEIASEYEAEGEEYRTMLIRVGSAVRNGGFPQKNDAPEDILAELLSSDEVYTELPFCYGFNGEEGQVILNGIMDVVYRKGNSWYIIDYKTNLDPDELDEKYREQLSAYKEAFFELTGNRAEALIYHIEV